MFTIKINFTGGIISPGDLKVILQAAHKAEIGSVSFGLRQQLLLKVQNENYATLVDELERVGIEYETNNEIFPNIVSSYPAEEIFILKNWLSEGVYKDIFDSFDYRPNLKINISDSNQSFTPLLTGNINWVASSHLHFWYLFIRFPKTNTIYEWKDIVYTNDIAALSMDIEEIILREPEKFYDNSAADGNELYAIITDKKTYNTKKAETRAQLPVFNLPYYEGLNPYENRYWLGIYQRNERFPLKLLYDICNICLATKIGQICSTPWKSLIIKGIEEKDRKMWTKALDKHRVNVRHAANELNFQVEDNSDDGLKIKNYLLKHLNREDTRSFGICIGIKTRRKSEVFSNILVRRKALIAIAGMELFYVYDILCAKDYNPNERTAFVFSRNNIRCLLPEHLRCAIISFYEHKAMQRLPEKQVGPKQPLPAKKEMTCVYQCTDCLTVYDKQYGDEVNQIPVGTRYENLSAKYCCPICETPNEDFRKIEKSILSFQSA